MSAIITNVDKQYADSRKLAARARLHTEYVIAEVPWFAWVARQLPLQLGDRVLDIGCGPGWFWAGAAAELPKDLALTLADLSPGMVAEAMDRCTALQLGTIESGQADATALPFDDGAFDAVIAMHMLYHLPDPAIGIAEMFRVLKPGGFLAVTTNSVRDMREMYALAGVLGSAPANPAGVAFGFEDAERLMQAQFGNVTMARHPAHMRITDPEDIFLALTSFPPGETASPVELEALRAAIGDAFEAGGGVLDVPKDAGLFLSWKPA